MALTVTPKITGQNITGFGSGNASYSYLHEPLEVVIAFTSATKKITIDLETYDTKDLIVVKNTIVKYAEYDTDNDINTLTVNLMELIRQYHDSNVYMLGNTTQLVSNSSSTKTFWGSSVSKLTYKLIIKADGEANDVSVVKIPIIGGRGYRDFTPSVATDLTKTNEFEILNLDLSNRWKGYPTIKTTLADPNRTALGWENMIPTTTVINPTLGKTPCGGYVAWKSKYGGWCYWGFELKVEKNTHRYTGSIEVGMFESVDGLTAIETDYTGIQTSYSITLKSLSLSKDELRAVSGIQSSPAIYLINDSGRMELMRLSSASVPLDSKANGGDFSVSLKSISKSSQTVR